ncbi:hypothetical protein GS424_012635 [Eggerthella guodeyinii]|uniref:Restriction endonuclease n=1 Tax=Eggerthella guodeyinii TaxID=2690837 RepID=A0A6L7ITU1_9ACTN|nr:hypothetical protein [Eggerthella guodeyinii]QOS67358.1 hypothetical protein GS424_012635 [Eggerthella guodeyinii]
MSFYGFRESENILGLEDPRIVEELRDELDKASSIIRPSIPLYCESLHSFQIQNMIGVLSLKDGTLIEIAPKIQASSWEQAVLGLIDSKTRFYISTTKRASREQDFRPTLTEVLAMAYSNLLHRAVLKEGPMLSYERERRSSSKLSGRLNLSKWIARASIDPAHFDITKDELKSDNEFSRAMCAVAERILTSNVTPATKRHLQRAIREMRPDCPRSFSANSSITERLFPEQWPGYRQAWEMASAFIRGGLFKSGSFGTEFGVEVAVEPWPMLETLLERCLKWICSEAHYADRYETQKSRRILKGCNRSVKPDGLLIRNGKIIACIDAKYKTSKLLRDDLYQAIATAATFKAPISILVYPDDAPMQLYPTTISDHPKAVATVGINMFSYSIAANLENHAIGIMQALEAVNPSNI